MTLNDKGLFYALLVLLFWLPIPLGSNRIWAWSIVEIYAFCLLIAWLWNCSREFDYRYLKPYFPLLALLGVVQLWVAVQIIPLPVALLEVLAPQIATVYNTVDVSWAPLSLDVVRTQTQSDKKFLMIN